MAIDGTTSDDIALNNLASVAETPAALSNLAFSNLIVNINQSQQNANSNQHSMDLLGLAVTAKAVNMVANLSPMEVVAVAMMDTGGNVAREASIIKNALESLNPPPNIPTA
ncbi:MAG TPA: hypothetical protein VGX92_09210 [Pyrinomonadaceae bacterium]|jgi:hypothetical protein|nr:hypothetical protein [Pyrinomonadaceae bacterium]